MTRRSLIRKWTAEDIAKLTELSQVGATLARAAGALQRHSHMVQRKARELGLKFPGVRAGLRKAGAIEAGRAASGHDRNVRQLARSI